MSKIEFLLLSGNATSGKDSLFKIINEIYPQTRRIALADALKADLDLFTKEKFGISAFTSITEEKELIRPLMVAYGKICRKKSQGTYWTAKVQPYVDICKKQGLIPVISDCRYDEYENDELAWGRKNGAKLIYLERLDKNNNLIPPPNEDERINNIKLKAKADLIIVWPTLENHEDRVAFVKDELVDFFNGKTRINI